MTTMEIAAEHGVSRQSIHAYRRSGAFPQPVEGEGSTRPRFRADEVEAFFQANPKQPGKRREVPPRTQQGDQPMAVYTVTMRVEAEAEVDAAQIREEIYDACRDVPFGFDVTEVSPEAPNG